jgi:hypothetical protein
MWAEIEVSVLLDIGFRTHIPKMELAKETPFCPL